MKFGAIISIKLYIKYNLITSLSNDSITDGHPLAYSYGGMAMSIMKLIRKCIINNAQYFGTYYGLPDPDADNTES